MVINLSGAVSSKTLNILVSAYNNCPSDETLTVYFSSDCGGSYDTAIAVADFLSRAQDISLICYGSLVSAGFLIAMLAKCDKTLLVESYALTHLAWTNSGVDESGNFKDEYYQFVASTPPEETLTYQICQEVKMPRKDLNKLKAGKDVLIPFDKLLVYFDRSKDI